MLLTLDLSSRVGWTVGFPATRAFSFGHFDLPKTGENIGRFAAAFDVWLRNMITGNEVRTVAFESPILPRQTSLATVRKLHGLCWHTEHVCDQLKIKCFEGNVQSIKKFICNNGHARKAEVIAAVRQFGFDTGDDDEADAIALRLYVLEQVFPDAAHMLGLNLGALGRAREKPAARQGDGGPS